MSAHTKEYITTAIIFRGTRRQNVSSESSYWPGPREAVFPRRAYIFS